MIIEVKEYVFKDSKCTNPQTKFQERFYPILYRIGLVKKYIPLYYYDLRITPETDEMLEYVCSGDILASNKGIKFIVLAKFDESKSFLVSTFCAQNDIDKYMPIKELVCVGRTHSE